MTGINDNLTILWEDRHLLVAHKGAGLPVQSAGIGRADAVSLLMNHLAERGRGGAAPYLGVVHRLDQPVQGLLVFGKDKKTTAHLSAQVQDGRMEKEYLALCRVTQKGQGLARALWAAPGKETLLENLLIQDRGTNTSRVVSQAEVDKNYYNRKEVKQARLYLAAEPETSLPEGDPALLPCRVRLLTGRHHQIRVQLAAAGLPIAGDRKYGQEPEEAPALPYPALCARRLGFDHPVTGERMRFSLEAADIWFLNQKVNLCRKRT